MESATPFGRVESSVVTSAASSPVDVSLLDFLDNCAPPVAFTIPGGACRTDASVDAEVPDVEVSTASSPGREAPSVCESAVSDVPVVPVAVPVVVEVPSDSGVLPVAPAVSVFPAEFVDAVSSASAIPGVVATAIPTPTRQLTHQRGRCTWCCP